MDDFSWAIVKTYPKKSHLDELDELNRHINECQNLDIWSYLWDKKEYIRKMKALQSKYRDVSPILEHCVVEEQTAQRMNESLNHAAYILQKALGRKEIIGK